MEYLNQLMGIASEDEFFMESQLLNYKLAIKFIYTEQNLQVKMLNFLLRAPKLMLSLL